MKVRVKISYQETICKEVSFIKELDEIENQELKAMIIDSFENPDNDQEEYYILTECENGAMNEECNKDKFYERNITGFEIEEVTE